MWKTDFMYLQSNTIKKEATAAKIIVDIVLMEIQKKWKQKSDRK